jgi:hypothetical protein
VEAFVVGVVYNGLLAAHGQVTSHDTARAVERTKGLG